MSDELLRRALVDYAVTIREGGWESGESIIKKWEKRIPDFRKWAYAAGALARADEILESKAEADDRRFL